MPTARADGIATLRQAYATEATSLAQRARVGTLPGSRAARRGLRQRRPSREWSRRRAALWSASGSGIRGCGGSGGPGGGSGPGSPPPPESSGREPELWYSKAGPMTSEIAHATASRGPAVRKVPAPTIPAFSLSANSPGRTAGTNCRSKARAQKCERLCLKEPRTEESAAEHITNITDITRRPVTRPVTTVETVPHNRWVAHARAGSSPATRPLVRDHRDCARLTYPCARTTHLLGTWTHVS